MIVRETKALYEFERKYAASLDTLIPYRDAAQLYEELWLRARDCGAISPDNPLEGLDADIEMARTLNLLPSP